MMSYITSEKPSISFKCFKIAGEKKLTEIFNKISQANCFNMETYGNGFHDIKFDSENSIIRGCYSLFTCFEVEHLEDGRITNTLFKKIESCEFIITDKVNLVFGKSKARKLILFELGLALGKTVSTCEFSEENLSNLQTALTTTKSISIDNLSNDEVKKVKIDGKIEYYQGYNIINAQHNIQSVSGVLTTPVGDLKVTLNRRGNLKVAKKGKLDIHVNNIHYIFDKLN